MKKQLVLTVSGALLAAPALFWSASAAAAPFEPAVYWQHSSGGFIRDGAGDCLRTPDWKPGTQIEGCDVIAKQEPVKVADSDNDGVADNVDRCPGTTPGVRVLADGCEVDSDNDGIVDSQDRCAATPSGAKVDATGCIVALKEPVSFELRVQFATDSAAIAQHYQPDFQRIAALLANDPGVKVVFKGHTDSTGTAAYNKRLSQRRAESVVQALVRDYGLDPARLTAEGYGEEQPIADNKTAAGRELNRRVEASVKVMVSKR